MPALTKKLPRIAVIRTSSIGDVVLASACLDLAKRLEIEVVWIGREPAMSLLKAGWPDVTFFTLPQSISQFQASTFFKELGPIDVVVDLQTNLRSKSIVRLFKKRGVPTISAHKYQRRRLLMIAAARIRQRILPIQIRPGADNFRQYKEMLQAFAKAAVYAGIEPERLSVELPLARPNLSLIAQTTVEASWVHELKFGDWIALAPGASYPTKQSPIRLWTEALETVVHLKPEAAVCGLFLAGSELDRKFALEVLDQLNWRGPVLNMAGKLTLVETAQALAKMRVLLTNDSGLLHIAESVGTPVVAIFGPTSEDFGFPPWRPESVVFSSPTGCRPCSKHGKKTCRFHDKLCFEAVNTLAVGSAAAKLISAPRIGSS